MDGALIGECIAIVGHRECLRNVGRLVIDTNRERLLSFLSILKERLLKDRQINDELDNLLEQAKVISKIDPNAIPKA